jgi:hypothetical protein
MTGNDRDRLAYALQQYDTDRKHGQHILDMTVAKGHQESAEDPILEVLRQAAPGEG